MQLIKTGMPIANFDHLMNIFWKINHYLLVWPKHSKFFSWKYLILEIQNVWQCNFVSHVEYLEFDGGSRYSF